MARIKITNGPTTYRNARGTAKIQPRSIMDKLLGKSMVSYSRPVPTINMSKTKSNKWKPAGPTSNGIGVGM